ncbi:cation:proton antiporter [Steroidobacter flavus]|uniref:Cation:proton antiporter n=1 Tax=Steroidobacter flavus TaxID=1842136 RepID=A0ABV8T2X8_9GAMM
MKLLKPIAAYLLTLLVAGGAIFTLIQMGNSLPGPQLPAVAQQGSPWAALLANLNHPLSHLFVQLLVIIAVARAVGGIFARLGLQAVVGEMVAGILLGPSLFGWLWPSAFTFVFPTDSMGALRLLSQVGICLFMFSVGMELNLSQARNKAPTAVAVSHASIVVPFVMGVALAYFVFVDFAGPSATFVGFALFMGISMSITAFPVLARILQERGMMRTPLGSTAITCAAVDDVTAWSILAFVVAIVRSTSLGGSVLALAMIGVLLAVMTLGVKRALPRWLGHKGLNEAEPSSSTLAVIVCVVLASALSTEVIGIHALFGAFLAGTVMPEVEGFRERIRARVEKFSSVLLLPLFFAFTGLRTEIGSLEGAHGWLLCLLIIVIATTGKLGASAIAARLSGMKWNESLQLGALMNTRGLMELIALNIGYDLGILSPAIFTMLVIMAVVTTLMTGPLLTLFSRKSAEVPTGGAYSAQ